MPDQGILFASPSNLRTGNEKNPSKTSFTIYVQPLKQLYNYFFYHKKNQIAVTNFIFIYFFYIIMTSGI